MKKGLKILSKIVVGILAILGIIFVALIIYWWPVIDRLVIRPCDYYPKAFADCIERNN